MTVNHMPYLAPEIALLYKSAHVDVAENHVDFDNALPRLSHYARVWLRNGLLRQDATHPWLAELG